MVYTALGGTGIRYAHEPPSDLPGTQEIRSPAEVLWAPRHATCLDLAITLTGACLKAGLTPVILLIEHGGTGGRHALVGVWVQEPPDDVQDELRAGTGVWETPPGWLPDLVRRTPDDSGQPLIVLDPVGVSTSLPSSPARGVHAEFGQAVANGADRLFDPRWDWQAGVDLARAWQERETYQPARRPPVSPLRLPYLDPVSARGPLHLLRADYRIVPFQPRDELTILRHWCTQRASRQTAMAIIDGTGGSGKTRLALELAQRLSDLGWYAGLLRHSVEGASWTQSVEWLATIVSPTLIIVDYADARAEDTKTLMRALSSRTGPAVVVLTARTVKGEWLTNLQAFLQRDGQILPQRQFDLPPEHPDSTAIFRRAAAAFAARRHGGTQVRDTGADTVIAAPERWTTLDYVLLGWLAARGEDELPTTRWELYEAALEHEERYWADVYHGLTGTRASPFILRRAATCLTLLAPVPERAGQALQAVPELADAAEWRENIRRTFAECFYAGPGDVLAMRPDPIADHLAVKVLRRDPDLLDRCLASLDNERLPTALANLNRASSTSPEAVSALFADWLRRHSGQWQAVLTVAAAQMGSALNALELIANEDPAVVPLAELAEAIPFEHVGLTRLGLAVETRRLQQLRETSMTEPANLAWILDRVGRRQSEVGNWEGALASITEAVQHYRSLTSTNPVYVPDLAGALNNLSNAQGETGDRAAALASITEAVQHYRVLADTNPVTYLPGFVILLNTLSNAQSESGDWVAALASITEAVQVQRTLADTNPAAHLPYLAISLNNLSNAQAATRNEIAALASITEAVQIQRTLADTNPAAHLPALATSLNNLSVSQGETDDRAAALGSITEAVQIQRTLADTNPAAHLPYLAKALSNLSDRQREVGDHDAALGSITEAVQIQRTLADTNPAAHLPYLAKALSNLSDRQREVGDHDAALGSITEAVQIQRTLADTNPAAHLPDLAASLNTLSNADGEIGDRAAALASITEAVQIQRTLADNNPAHLPNLAASLHTLSVSQGETGDRAAALASITEAVQVRRTLADANPAAHLPGLAISLNTLSIWEGKSGHWAAALASITEAVQIQRTLADTNPAHLPDLAISLNTVSVWQRETGDRDAALASAAEAVQHYRALADTNPAAYLHNLAASLDTLSVSQGETGDQAAALASITEAVQIQRTLADTNPAAYLPGLASSLNTLSGWQGQTGNRAAALASITEAVQIRRTLADTNPAAYLPGLAGSLNNLSIWHRQTGDRDAALASVTEAVQHYRALADTNPAAYLHNLAASLHTLSVSQGETGDQAAALASVTEAVQHYRALADTNPAAYLPGLAISLNTLSSLQAETGDQAAALASITEAVQIRRTLADTNPAAYLPDLAGSLNNLSIWHRQTGDRDAALASAAEAVQHYRALADTNPAAYLYNLAASLSNLALLLDKPLTADGDPWVQIIAAFDNPLIRAELRASYAHELAADGRHDAAIDQLANAAVEAQSGDAAPLGRARRTIRKVASTLSIDDPRLPPWATGPVPGDHIELINQWAGQRGWPAIDTFLNEHADALQNDNFRASLSVIADLFPENPPPASLAAFLTDIDDHGLDSVLASGGAAHADTELLNAWIATPTWEESAKFLQEHSTELITPRLRELLQRNSNDRTCRQHLAILYLIETIPLGEVYRIITDTAVASECALDLVESGNLNQLALILTAAPSTAVRGITGAFLQAVMALASEDYDAARQLSALITEHGNPSQREAFAIRLRALSSHLPDPSPALDIADIIAPDVADMPEGFH